MRGNVAERNAVIKDHRKVSLRFALAYPSPYSVGMSNLGIRLIYEMVNNNESALCERFFFEGYRTKPTSIESGLGMEKFDIIGFSLQHEMDYARMLDMLNSSGIPMRKEMRRGPSVIAGGPAPSSNPVPLEPFVDYFIVGDAEPVLMPFLDAFAGGEAREMAGSVAGIYRAGVPSSRSNVRNLDSAYHSLRQVHPVAGEGFSSTFLLEISRGCSRGCRFCMECFTYGPKRERSFGRISEILDEGLKLTETRSVTCISSAFFDHPSLKEVLSLMKERRLRFSLPSLRISDLDESIPALLAAGGQKSITIAPETPSPRLRKVINKQFEEGSLSVLLRMCREAGIRQLKMYFMLGIPGETEEDLDGLGPLISEALSAGFSPQSIHISVNPMVPKSNTPFQWVPMISAPQYSRMLASFKRICSRFGVRRVESMDYRWGNIQAFLSTGGAEASLALERLAEDIASGGSGDLGSWRRISRLLGRKVDSIYIPKPVDSTLPWEIIKGSVPKSILLHEYERALE
uniref:Radical SAM protein n=1 Tax=Candidatus Methanomethylicus mesodigestus TaxID=1867258 RepID=A0A7C3F3J5_9CREN